MTGTAVSARRREGFGDAGLGGDGGASGKGQGTVVATVQARGFDVGELSLVGDGAQGGFEHDAVVAVDAVDDHDLLDIAVDRERDGPHQGDELLAQLKAVDMAALVTSTVDGIRSLGNAEIRLSKRGVLPSR
ncbi:MAG: hypothetical protein Q8P38_05790 [Candidatus Nanopelagicales bacterium]|nr:hypothetical protein [Candidatus Nanopelagicales bacterium]